MKIFNSYDATRIENMYGLLKDEAREALTLAEFSDAIGRAIEVLEDFADAENRFTVYGVGQNAICWANHKWPIIKAFKASALYDPANPLKIVRKADLHRIIDKYAIREYSLRFRAWCDSCYYDSTFLSYVIDNNKVTLLAEENVKGIKDALSWFAHDNENVEAPRRLSEENEAKVWDRLPHNGEKTSRYVRKLVSMLTDEFNRAVHTDEENKANERAFAGYADAINPMTFRYPAVLSVDLVDYLLAANGNSWDSCYAINVDGCAAEHSRAIGTWSYANDATTMISYYLPVDFEGDGDDITREPKVYRQMIFWDDSSKRIGFSRLYPQSCDNDETQLYSDARKAMQTLISEVFNLPNYWRAFWYGGHVQPEEFVPSSRWTGYNDMFYFRTCVCYNVMQCPNDIEFLKATREQLFQGDVCEYGEVSYCPNCGCVITGNGWGNDILGRYICADCDCYGDDRYDCDECGYRCDEDELYYCEADDMRVCEDCCAYDSYTDTHYVESRHDTYSVHTRFGEQRYVDYALEEATANGDVFYCEDCGE